MLLEVKDITVHYFKVPAIRNISITVDDGEIVALIGSNGAGKTTTLRAISGLKQPTTGEIHFKGQRIDKLAPHKINALGIAMVPEGRRVFPQMTVLENLLMGAFLRKEKDAVQKDLNELVFRHFPRLKERTAQAAGTLSGGEQQMLTLARTLMGNPELLLLDEPVEGLAPLVVKDLGKQILKLKKMGQTILFSEQNIRFATLTSDRAYVIDNGKIRYQGSIEELRADEEIKKKYLMI